MLTETDQQKIVQFVQREPRTVQEIAQHLEVSWVTAERYCTVIAERTGLLALKTFRRGTQGALKLVYYNYADRATSDAVRANLLAQIRTARFKHHFDFLEIYQHANEKQKSARIVQSEKEASREVIEKLLTAAKSVLIWSGNLSIIRMNDGKRSVKEILTTLLERGVRVKILCRVSLGSQQNLSSLRELLTKYPQALEIRHAYQPLRGILVDGALAHFKDEENSGAYKEDELPKTTRIIYEFNDADWTAWLEQTFWAIYRTSIDHTARWREIERLQ